MFIRLNFGSNIDQPILIVVGLKLELWLHYSVPESFELGPEHFQLSTLHLGGSAKCVDWSVKSVRLSTCLVIVTRSIGFVSDQYGTMQFNTIPISSNYQYKKNDVIN